MRYGSEHLSALMLARVRHLASTDIARRASWVRAYRWAQDRAADHVVHVGGYQLPLSPPTKTHIAGEAPLQDVAYHSSSALE